MEYHSSGKYLQHTKKLAVISLIIVSLIVLAPTQHAYAAGVSFGGQINLSNNSGTSQSPQVAISGSNVYVVWTDDSSGNNEILFKASSDSGVTFGSIINLSNNAGSSSAPVISATGTDVYVAWTDTTPGNNDVLFVASTNSGSSFGGQVNLSNNAGSSSAPVISATGTDVYVAWVDDTPGNNDIFFKTSDNSGSTFGGLQNLSSNSGFSTSPAIASSGTSVYVAWQDNTLGNYEILFEAGTINSVNIVFDASQYKLSQTAQVTITDSSANHNPGTIETISATITSTTDSSTGITLILTETGVNTGIFTGQFTFTSSSSSGTSLKASAGDIITATYSGQTSVASIFSRTVSFDFANYNLGSQSIITVNDQNSNLDPTIVETIQVTVTSTSDSTGISTTLTETGVNTGIFKNTKLIFVGSNGPFTVGSNVKATLTDSSKNLDPNAIDTVSIKVTSTTDPVGITPILSETNVNTGIFTQIIKLNATGSSGNNIHVTGGDVVSAEYQPGTLQNGISNILITPNPNPGVGAVLAKVGDIITATYSGSSASSTILPSGGGGGGGGGLIRPGLVLDAIAASLSLGGGGGAYNSPPLYTFDRSVIENLSIPDDVRKTILNPDPLKPIPPLENVKIQLPFYINNKGFAIASYANTIQTDTEETGKPILIKLNIRNYYEITHVGFYTNVPGASKEIYDSDTYIIYDKGSTLKIVDPHQIFSSVTLDKSKNGTNYSFLYNITFAKPMNKSDIIFRTWNDRESSGDFKIYEALQVTKSEDMKNIQNTIQNIQQNTTNSLSQQGIESTIQNENDIEESIKMWGGYSSKSISDSEFLSKIGINGNSIPHWVMKSTKWFVDGEINLQEFVDSIKYLDEKGFIK